MRLLILSATFLLIVACEKRSPKPQADSAPFAPLPAEPTQAQEPITDIAPRNVDEAERQVIKALGGKAFRAGYALFLTGNAGKPLKLLDNPNIRDDKYHQYGLRHYWPQQGFFVLEVYLYEGHLYSLVDERTGKETLVSGEPVLGPDGRKFVTTSFDLEAEYSANSIEVWHFKGGDLQNDFILEPKKWGPTKPVWMSSEEIQFIKNVIIDVPGNYAEKPARLVFENGNWHLKD